MYETSKRNTVVGDDIVSENFYCDICDQTDLVPSLVELTANYGSAHDGERVKLRVCGDCMDWLIDAISERAGKPKNIVNW